MRSCFLGRLLLAGNPGVLYHSRATCRCQSSDCAACLASWGFLGR